jgi:cytoskeletal protein RodZ
MNKKGLLGKIFAVIGIIFLVIILMVGITAWQVYSLYLTVQEENLNVNDSITSFQSGDCSKILNIQTSMSNIKSKAQSTCLNPIIRITLDKIKQVPIKCKDASVIESQTTILTTKLQEACNNQTLMNQLKNYTINKSNV